MAKLLHDGLAKMGLELYCPNPSDRLPTVTTIKIPDGFPWAKVNGYLMEKYALEIAGGLGPSAGKVFLKKYKVDISCSLFVSYGSYDMGHMIWPI